MRTRAMVVLAAVLLLAGTLAIWRQTTRLPLVSLETPRRGELEARFVASGRVQARTIHIESPRGGLLRSVPVEENQAVRRGQVLATFEDSELRARVEGARAALESAQRRRDELLRRRALAEAQGEADVEAARAEYQQIRWQYEEVRRGASPDALRKAEAALKEAQARLEAARAARQRAEELFAQDIISREELEKARTEEEVARARRDQAASDLDSLRRGPSTSRLEAARAQVEAALARLRKAQEARREVEVIEEQLRAQELEVQRLEAELAAARASLAQSVLAAPADGVVSQVLLQPGDVAGAKQPVMYLLLPQRLWIEANVDPQDAAYVSPHQPVTVRLPALPAAAYRGRITRVARALDIVPGGPGNTRFLRIEVELQDKVEGLRPGLEADVEGRTVLVKDALLIPRSALRKKDGTDVVWVVRQGRVVALPVKVAAVTPEAVAVASGLDPGAEVIVQAPDDLAEGDRVRTR